MKSSKVLRKAGAFQPTILTTSLNNQEALLPHNRVTKTVYLIIPPIWFRSFIFPSTTNRPNQYILHFDNMAPQAPVTSIQEHKQSSIPSNLSQTSSKTSFSQVPPTNQLVTTTFRFYHFNLDHFVWLDAMMIRRQAEGRPRGLFVIDAQDFYKRFGWTPPFSAFIQFEEEYERDPGFYFTWCPGQRLYPDLPGIEK